MPIDSRIADIHPNAKWGRGITMDHGGGCVIGETAVIGDNVYLMHDVTLGSTGMSDEWDRHPKIEQGAFIAAKATVLGNIRIGAGAVVGAHALVTKPVPDGYTAIGLRQRATGRPIITRSGWRRAASRSQTSLRLERGSD